MNTTPTTRWWVIAETILIELLTRVEHGEITADEAYAQLLEHSTLDNP